MALAETGNLTHHLKIICESSKTYVDKNGDRQAVIEVVACPWAMKRTDNANDVVADIAQMKRVKQFVIRHRFPNMKQITTDMKVIDRGITYEIDDYNDDDQFQEWDVIICHEVKDNG